MSDERPEPGIDQFAGAESGDAAAGPGESAAPDSDESAAPDSDESAAPVTEERDGGSSGGDGPSAGRDGRGLRAFARDDDTPDRVVCHVDMDCFYAACERLREPALRGEPLVVGRF